MSTGENFASLGLTSSEVYSQIAISTLIYAIVSILDRQMNFYLSEKTSARRQS